MKQFKIFLLSVAFLITGSSLIAQETFSISGAVLQTSGSSIAMGFSVSLHDESGAIIQTTVADPTYIFENVPANQSYEVRANGSSLNVLNGVTTYDQVLIARHILGQNVLDSPYKIIAADVNGSGTVTTLDIVKARKVILNMDVDFAPNANWRFIPADYVFPNPTNPFEFPNNVPSNVIINNLDQNVSGQNFVAIKIGDVN